MKMRKMLAVCIILSLLNGGVYAEDNKIMPVYNDNIITFALKTDIKAGDVVLATVIEKGMEDVANHAYAIDEIVVDAEGYAVVSFEMPELKRKLSDSDGEEKTDGVYQLSIKGKGKSAALYEFDFVSKSTRDDVLLLLSDEDTDLLSVLSPESPYRTALTIEGIDFGIYDTLNPSEQEDVIQKFSVGEDKSVDMLKTVIGVAAIQYADAEDILNMMNPIYDEVTFSAIEDEKCKAFIEEYFSNKGAGITVENIDDEYAIANVLYILNHARYHEIDGLLSEHKELLSLDGTAYDNYVKLSSAKKTTTCENMVKKLKTSPVKTVEALHLVIENAIPSDKGSGGSGGSQSSGGSGGFITSGNASSSAIVTTITPKEPEAVNLEEVFDDMQNAEWAMPAVERLYAKGIVSGVGDKKFAPSENITREAFVTMLVKAKGLHVGEAEKKFEDVVENAWYAPYVSTAYNSGICYGVSESHFGVGTLLTRQDMITMIARLISDEEEPVRGIEELVDYDEVSDYAKQAVKNLYERGLISGKGNGRIAPQEYTTRAEAAQILYMLLEEI